MALSMDLPWGILSGQDEGDNATNVSLQIPGLAPIPYTGIKLGYIFYLINHNFAKCCG